MTDEPMPSVDDLTIRRAEAVDGDAVADVWLAAWRATFDFPPAYPDENVRAWLAGTLIPTRETWVAAEPDGTVVAMMALSHDMVDQLYVAPAWIGRGLGSRLIELAKARRPHGVDLYCFQVNHRARRFYEARGFVVVAEGDGSNNAERQPDLRYAWHP